MLSPRAIFHYHQLLRLGCFFSLIPFSWNIKTCRLGPPTRATIRVIRFHSAAMVWVLTFSSIRLAQSIRKDPAQFPLFVKVLNFVWIFAAALTNVIFFQFQILGDEIRNFINSVLARLEVSQEKETAEYSAFTKYISAHLFIAVFLMYSNPAPHALIIGESACAPQFISSLILNCATPGTKVPYLQSLPFFFLENYIVTMVLFEFSFSYCIALLGMGWAYGELLEIRRETNSTEIGEKYRHAERIVAFLNTSVRYYLASFGSLMFVVLAFLLYGCIRLLHLDIRANLMFPSCAIRCGYETLTPLALAGRLNRESCKVLEQWCNKRKDKLEERIKKSCKTITVLAGSMYSFEKTILLVSLNNLIQLTLNMLVAFRLKDETYWEFKF